MNKEVLEKFILNDVLKEKFDKGYLLEFLFFMALGCYMFYKFGILSGIYNLMIGGIVVLILLAVLFFQTYSFKEKIILTLTLIISFIILYTSTELNILMIVLLIFSAKNISIDDIIKFLLKTYLIFFVFMIIANLLGFYDNDFGIKYMNDTAVMVKAYGFGHPNQISNRFLAATVMFFFLKRTSFKYSYVIIPCILQIFVYYISLSRTGLLMFLASVIIYIFTSKLDFEKIISYILLAGFWFMNVISILLPFLYADTSRVTQILNRILTGRIRLASNFFEKYDIRLFGQTLDFSGYDNVLDSAVPYIILTYGVILYAVIIYFSGKLFINSLKLNDYYIIIYFVLFYLIGLSELVVINPSYNFTLFFFAKLLDGKTEIVHLKNNLI